MTAIRDKCDTCSRVREIQSVAVPFAPMSVANCTECLATNAWPLWLLHAAVELAGGYGGLQQWFCDLPSFKDGLYINGDVVRALYRADGGSDVS